MDNDSKFWATIWLAIILGIATIATTAIICEHLTKKTALQGGYSQVAQPGMQSFAWQRQQPVFAPVFRATQHNTNGVVR